MQLSVPRHLGPLRALGISGILCVEDSGVPISGSLRACFEKISGE